MPAIELQNPTFLGMESSSKVIKHVRHTKWKIPLQGIDGWLTEEEAFGGGVAAVQFVSLGQKRLDLMGSARETSIEDHGELEKKRTRVLVVSTRLGM
ncbi:hypothetical protein PR202_ga31283 [Eleusine coracana subsp. coracana]|uniref:Uncharacterized protein n=1 Tax=Eleusine coracana subsp. coracana TaxID=191504 RepID=A0AAV5DQM2_ELECO|nr:hypothetical protein PR202_ga31283 [Eleusine coracana subsp. coracana]